MSAWNLIFLIFFIIYFFLRGFYIGRTKKTVKKITRMDATEKILLAAVFIGNIFFPLLYIFTPIFSFADYSTSVAFKWPGIPALLIALWLFRRSHEDLGLNWSQSLEIRDGHTLVTRGIYRRIRHPMYTAILLFGLGQGLLLENWLGGWSGLVTFVALIVLRIPKEEQMMTEVFGDDYRRYMQTTGRLFPDFRS